MYASHKGLSPIKQACFYFSGLILLLINGCSPFSPFPMLNTLSANASFQQFTQELFQQKVTADSLTFHYSLCHPEKQGIPSPPISYGAVEKNPDTSLSSLEQTLSTLSGFPYDKLTYEHRLTYDILRDSLSTALAGFSYPLYEEPFDAISGIHLQLPLLLTEYAFYNEKDVQDYLCLLGKTRDYFLSLCQFELKKSQAGLFMPQSCASLIAEQCHRFLSPDNRHYLDTTFETRLRSLPKLSEQKKQTYLAKNRALLSTVVFPAYKHLAELINDLKHSSKNEQGLCFLPLGKEYYAYLAKKETCLDTSLPELKTLIERQINTDKNYLLSRLPFRLPQATPTFPSPSHILSTLQKHMKEDFPPLSALSPQIKYVPAGTEENLSPAFYLASPLDDLTKHIIYLNPKATPQGIKLFTTLAHESYPGHLYQHAYFLSTNPDKLRPLLRFNGYSEGWAIYSEMLSYSYASLSPAHASLLQHYSSLLLGLCAYLDIGIHYDGLTPENACTFFSACGLSQELAKEIITPIYQNILASPTHYLKYYAGYVAFLRLREKARQLWGEHYSALRFHKAVLEIGPAPFSILEHYVLTKNKPALRKHRLIPSLFLVSLRK